MKRINLVIEVDEDLEIIDKCGNQEIVHGNEYDRYIPVGSTVSQTVVNALTGISVRAKTWTKQKLAEKCNNLILSHIGYLVKQNKLNENCDLYYPHFRMFVYPESK